MRSATTAPTTRAPESTRRHQPVLGGGLYPPNDLPPPKTRNPQTKKYTPTPPKANKMPSQKAPIFPKIPMVQIRSPLLSGENNGKQKSAINTSRKKNTPFGDQLVPNEVPGAHCLGGLVASFTSQSQIHGYPLACWVTPSFLSPCKQSPPPPPPPPTGLFPHRKDAQSLPLAEGEKITASKVSMPYSSPCAFERKYAPQAHTHPMLNVLVLD